MTARNVFRSTRMVLSFALLGAIVAGSFFGWVDSTVDPRAVGAVTGGAGILLFKALHFV